MAKRVIKKEEATQEEVQKVLTYEVIPGTERVTIMAKGGPYKLSQPQTQKALKFLYELGIKNIRKNG